MANTDSIDNTAIIYLNDGKTKNRLKESFKNVGVLNTVVVRNNDECSIKLQDSPTAMFVTGSDIGIPVATGLLQLAQGELSFETRPIYFIAYISLASSNNSYIGVQKFCSTR